MRPISARFRKALGVSHKRATKITCTIPGGEPVTLAWDAGSVSSSNSTGARYQASLTLTPVPGFDTYGLVSTPGAIFDIDHGIDYGAGNVELVDCGVYEAASGGVRLGDGGVSLSLVDQWQRVERCRFISAHSPGAGTRSALIGQAVTAAVPTAPLVVLTDGGVYEEFTNVWDRDRTQFVRDMAKDGALDAYFDAAGAFVTRPQPIIEPTAAVWTFRTGEASNINTADRERPFDRLYNTVIVEPDDETQSWDRQVIILADPDHPRHPDKIGVVPFWHKSPTLYSASEVTAAGVAIMQRVLGNTETISINALGNPALEVGDAVAVVHGRTDTDPGFQATHIIDSFQMDLATGAMTLATRSSALAELEES